MPARRPQTAFELTEAARVVLSFPGGENANEIIQRERLRKAAYSEASGYLSEAQPLFRIDALRIMIHNRSKRTISGIRVFVDGPVMQFTTLLMDGNFLGAAQSAQFKDAVQWKPGLLLPPLPAIPSAGDLRLSIHGLIDPGRDVGITTDDGIRVRAEKLVWVPRRRFLQWRVQTWE